MSYFDAADTSSHDVALLDPTADGSSGGGGSSSRGGSLCLEHGESFGVKLLGDATDLRKAPHGERKGTILSSTFNLSSTILGASCLAMPHACKNAGLVVYICLLILLGLMSEFSIRLLVESTKMTGQSTYAGIGKHALGRGGELAALLSVLIQQLGACTAYIKIIGDILGPIVKNLPDGILSAVSFWQIVIAGAVILPLVMLKTMNSLRFSSLMALLLIMCFVLVLTIDGSHKIHGGIDASRVSFGPGSAKSLFDSVPVICFAFVCHMNVFPVIAELKDPTTARTSAVSRLSVLVCFVVYVLAGCLGYLAFLEDTDPDIIKSYQHLKHDTHSDAILLPRSLVKAFQCGIGFALVFTYPIIAYELRHSVDKLLFGNAPFSMVRHVSEGFGQVFVSSTIAILVPSVTTVFGFTGATTGCLIVFILPALFYIHIDKTPLLESRTKMMAMVQLVIGALLVPTCVVVLIIEQIHPFKEPT